MKTLISLKYTSLAFLMLIISCQKDTSISALINIDNLTVVYSIDNNLEIIAAIQGVPDINNYEYGILYQVRPWAYGSSNVFIEYNNSEKIMGTYITPNSFSVKTYLQPNDSTYHFCAYIVIDGQYYYSDYTSHIFSTLEINSFSPKQVSEGDVLTLNFNKSIQNINDENSLKVFFNGDAMDIRNIEGENLGFSIPKVNSLPDSNFVEVHINDLIIKEYIPEKKFELVSTYSSFPQEKHYYTLFKNGSYIYIGGSPYGDNYYKDYYIFNTTNSSWSKISNFTYQTDFINIGFTSNRLTFVGNPYRLSILNPSAKSWTEIYESWDEEPYSSWPESRWDFAVVGSEYQAKYYMATRRYSDYNFYAFNSNTYIWNKLTNYPTEETNSSRGETSFILNGNFYVMTNNDLYRYNISSETWHNELESTSDFFRIGGSFIYKGEAYIIARGCHEYGEPGYCLLDNYYKIWKYNSSSKNYSLYNETLIEDTVVGAFSINSDVYVVVDEYKTISIYKMIL